MTLPERNTGEHKINQAYGGDAFKSGEESLVSWKRIAYLAGIERWLSHIETGVNALGAAILGLIMVAVVINVATRYLLNLPLRGHVDLVELALAVAVFWGISYTYNTGGHVRMDLLLRIMAPRRRNALLAVGCLIALAGFLAVSIATWQGFLIAKEYGDVSPSVGLPTWPTRFAIFSGCLLLVFRLFLRMIQHIVEIGNLE